MTRINIGVQPEELPDKLLLAEHREIKRLPNHLIKHGYNGNAPSKFTLNSGHVLFCLTIGYHTFMRYKRLYKECLRRGFKVTDYSESWKAYENFPALYRNYQPKLQDRLAIIERIELRGFKLL